MNVVGRLKKEITSGSARSAKAKKNIVFMLFIKGASILIGLVMVPLTLSYVDSGTYGIWLTLSSMIGWISFFDIGLNNGLKNKLAEAIAAGDTELGRKYVSTTYAVLSLIFIPIMVILLIVAPLLDWQQLLNISVDDASGLLASVCVVITYFCVNFILNTINVVLLADQRPADSSLRSFIQQLVSLLIIFFLVKTTSGSLLKLCIGLCISPLLVSGIFNITLFSGRYKVFAPSLRYVDFHQIPSLMRLGVQFFIIQIAGVIQYQLVNFLIIRHFGPNDVTAYNIAYKYFNVLYMVWGIIITPVWAAVTDAFSKKDFIWVKNTQRKYLKLFFIFCILGILMLIFSKQAYHLWVGESVSVSFILSLWVFIYIIVFMFGSIYVNILNGAGELKIQTISCMISPFVFIGVTFLMMYLECGPSSIIIGSVIANFNGFILAPIQYRSLMSRKLIN